MAEVYNKIGFHVGPGGNPTGIGDWERKLDAAGIPFFLKSADNYGPLFEGANIARASGIPHNLVFRLSTAGQGDGFDYDVPDYSLSPALAAARHWQRTTAKLPSEFDPELVWVEPINEVEKERADWLGHFAAEIAELALEDGYKVTLFGWAAGEPEADHWQTEGMKRYLTMCAQHPDRLAVSLHEYSYDVGDIRAGFPYQVGRFQFLFDACDDMNIARPTVHITEWGWTYEEIPGVDDALADIDDIAEVYAQHPEIKGAGIWYLGAGFGGIAGLAQKLISLLADFTLTKRYAIQVQPPVSPPPSPLGRGRPRVQYPRVYVLLAPGMTAEWAHAAVQATWNDTRYTIGGSADDGGIGDLDEATVLAINPAAWGSGEDGTGLAGFYQKYYSHVHYVPITAASPAQLQQKLREYAGLQAPPPLPPPPPPPPAGNTKIGLHTGAGGWSPSEEIAEFADLRPEVIKTMSHHRPEDVAALAAAHPAASWIVRVFLSMGGRNVSPQQFLNDTLGDLRRTLDLLAGKDVVIELHNEPNLRSEGLDSSWANGSGFNTWYLDLFNRYRQALPGRQFIFPGLSPGFAYEQNGERRQEHVSFWQQCRPAIEASAGLGIHLYWSNVYPMVTTLGQLDTCRDLFPTIPIYVTEASNNKGGRTPAQKAAEYVEFRKQLQYRREVRAVTYFIASPGDHADLWGWQGNGSCESWAGQGIGRLVRQQLG